MHTVCCSGCLSCHACSPNQTHPLPCIPPVMHAPTMHAPPAMHAPLPYMSLSCMTPCHACPPATHICHHTCPPPCKPPAMYTPNCHTCPSATHAPHGQNDRGLWKHYLSATTVADGNNFNGIERMNTICNVDFRKGYWNALYLWGTLLSSDSSVNSFTLVVYEIFSFKFSVQCAAKIERRQPHRMFFKVHFSTKNKWQLFSSKSSGKEPISAEFCCQLLK